MATQHFSNLATAIEDLSPHISFPWKEVRAFALRFGGGVFSAPVEAPHQQNDSFKPYLPGDPTRSIDWRTYGRSDELLLRQKPPEADMPQSIVIDFEASMHWPPSKDFAVTGMAKAEIACRLGFSLASLFLKSGGQCNIFVRKKDYYQIFGYGDLRGLIRLLEVFDELESMHFSRESLKSLEHLERDLPKSGRIIYLSDFFDDEFFEQSVTQKKSLLFQIHSVWESNLAWLKSAAKDTPHTQSDRRIFLREELVDLGLYAEEWKAFQETRLKESHKAECFYVSLHEKMPVSALDDLWKPFS